MSTIASTILPHLPYLRRFARSLSGRQQSGDAYVAAVLESLVADPSAFPQGEEPKVALYKVFAKFWNSVEANNGRPAGQIPAEDGETSIVDRRIEAMMPIPRQAFLLVAVEGFSPDQAARILDRSPVQIEADLDEAGREIAEQVATDILIIEDEPLIAMDLESIVTTIGHTVIGVARTKREAAAIVAKKRPGLVLADVQLADGSSGLDAVREILEAMDVPVIFITAYPEQVLTGRRPEPTFLIPKPFQQDTVRTIISQALFFDVKAHNVDRAPSRV
jgi:DNA-directed RNA polymerase specialized sigma24 family protein/CheY-like chemotaxis protein